MNADSLKWQEIKSLDLTTVKEKLRSKKGRLWKWRNRLDMLEAEYKQFLYLIYKNPGKTIVPWSQDMDDLWHEHILDTNRYAQDCQTIFGRFIHHDPNLAKGSTKQVAAFSETKRLYNEAFGPKIMTRKRGTASTEPGCGSYMPIIFDGSSYGAGAIEPVGYHCADAGHSESSSSNDSSGGDGGSSSGGGDSGGGSSCGGGGCGGGGD